MKNTPFSIGRLFGEGGREIEEKILNTTSVLDRINHLETFLVNRLADPDMIGRIIRSTVETILAGKGRLSVDELSKRININRRQLERKFTSTIGLSPKQLSKTIRLQAAIKMLLNKKYASLTTLAHAGEYYDQSHFIKDFKEFTGLTPKEFYGGHLEMSSLFYGID